MENKKINTEISENTDPISDASGEKASLTFKKKLENFFYHYKFQTIAVAFLTFVLIWAVITSIGNNEDEAYIGYVGDYSYSMDEQKEKSIKMTDGLNVDLFGEGKSDIGFHSLVYMSDEQVIEKAKEIERLGDTYTFSPARNETNYNQFISDLGTGDTAIWMVSHETYERMEKSVLMPISEVLGDTHPAAVDEYALDCSKLDFGTKFMRENCYNSYLIMRHTRQYSSIMGTEEMNLQEARDKALFKAIVEYKK